MSIRPSTLPHKTIIESLKSQGLDQHSISIIEEMYREAGTQIDGTGYRIALRRGIKQGDTLSPLLFNIVMDPLVRALQDEGVYSWKVDRWPGLC